MRSRSLPAPGIAARTRPQRTPSQPVALQAVQVVQHADGSDDHRPARLIFVSPVGQLPDAPTEAQLTQWSEDLDSRGLRMVHAALGNHHDDLSLLCTLLTPFIDATTQVVLLQRSDAEPVHAAIDVIGAIAGHLRALGVRGPEPIVADEYSLLDGDLDPRLLAALSPESHTQSIAIDARLIPFHALVVMGDLFDPLPPALLVAKAGPLTADERTWLQQLEDRLERAPLLCLTLEDPLTDIERLQHVLRSRLTPLTPTIVLGRQPQDRHAATLMHQLALFCSDLHPGTMPPIPGCLASPRSLVVDPTVSLDVIQAMAKSADAMWSDSVGWLDTQYLKQLNAWTLQPGHCSPRYPAAGLAIVRYFSRLLTSTRKEPQVPVNGMVSLLGLCTMPPLPPTRHFSSLTLSSCAFDGFTELPSGIESLHVRSCGLVDIKLDAVKWSEANEIHLEGNAFTQVPACLWQLPKGVKVFLTGNPLDDSARRTLVATRDAPGYVGPTFLFDGPAGDPQVESALARALRNVFGSRSVSRVPLAWRPALRRMATPEFVHWVQRLGELPSGLRVRLAPRLGALIAQCAISKSLRQLVLQTVYDASISCNDRILLSWERVQLACQCHDASRQKWAPGPLIALARQVFRIEEMMKIAQQTIRQQQEQALAEHGESDGQGHSDAVDDVEVVLAYLPLAHGPLAYPNDTGFGQFIREEISGVSLRQVAQAIRHTRHLENEHFATFLVRWDPWLRLLEREKPHAFARIRGEADNTERLQRITRRITRNADAVGLSGRELDDAVTKGIADAVDRRQSRRLLKLTRELLADQGAAGLLDAVWPTQ